MVLQIIIAVVVAFAPFVSVMVLLRILGGVRMTALTIPHLHRISVLKISPRRDNNKQPFITHHGPMSINIATFRIAWLERVDMIIRPRNRTLIFLLIQIPRYLSEARHDQRNQESLIIQ